MAITKADLRTAVLRRLGVLAVGETPSAEDAETVEATISRVHAELQADGIAYWSVNATPDGVAEPLIYLVASYVAPEFGLPAGDTTTFMRRLRSLTAVQSDATQVISAEYF